jgi:hypothetical protein
MPKKWTIASARQHLPTLVGLSAREPQHVYRRDKLVAAVVNPELIENVERRPPMAGLIAELQRICTEEAYELPIAPRRDRSPTRTRRKAARR